MRLYKQKQYFSRMKYLSLLLLLCACSEEPTSNIATLQGNLKFLKQQRDSLVKMSTLQKEKAFEQEINLAPELLSRDTIYQSAQKELNRLKLEINSLDREIESTEAAIYKPH